MMKNKNFCYNEIELDYVPRRAISTLMNNWSEPEMTEFESAFLCGVLEKFKPKKIVEIGVAAGSTTAIILQSMTMIRSDDFVVHSVDYYDRLWSNPKKKTGFMAEEANSILKENGNYSFALHLGKPACAIDEIGDDIDCLILDTIHVVPGEILDFITMLPHIKNGAVVILHDIGHNLRDDARDSYATGLLFSSVVAKKYINRDTTHPYGYPNIGAFVVDEQTRACISNLFLSLMISWTLCTPTDLWEQYRIAINKYYDSDLIDLFDRSIVMQKKMITRYSLNAVLPYDKLTRGSKIVLYGAGHIGRIMREQILQHDYASIPLWVDKNYESMEEEVKSINSIKDAEYDYVLIAVENKNTAFDIYTDLLLYGVDRKKIVWYKDW